MTEHQRDIAILTPQDARRLEDVRRIVDLLDSQFVLPGTGMRFGLDGLIGLIPGIGDTVTGLAGAYVIGLLARLGLPGHIQARMWLNLAIDWVIGAIPVLGDIFDFGFKAHRRNLALAERWLERHGGGA